MTAVFEYRVGCEVAPVCSTLRSLLFAQWSSSDDQKLNEHPLTCLSDRCAALHAANPHRSPRSLLFIYKMAVVRLENKGLIRWLCSLFVALFTHHWSPNRTRFKEEAHNQYKNIVQQFSCHSKHSYLSVNGPVTSAAIQIKKQQHNLLHKAKIKGGIDHISGLHVFSHLWQIMFTLHHN